jgi:hypothetical protein
MLDKVLTDSKNNLLACHGSEDLGICSDGGSSPGLCDVWLGRGVDRGEHAFPSHLMTLSVILEIGANVSLPSALP